VGVVLWIMVLPTVILARERTRKDYSGLAPGGGLSGGVGLNRAGGGPPLKTGLGPLGGVVLPILAILTKMSLFCKFGTFWHFG